MMDKTLATGPLVVSIRLASLVLIRLPNLLWDPMSQMRVQYGPVRVYRV